MHRTSQRAASGRQGKVDTKKPLANIVLNTSHECVWFKQEQDTNTELATLIVSWKF